MFGAKFYFMKNYYIFWVCLFVYLGPNKAIAQNRLMIPDTLSGNSIGLHLQKGTHVFYPNTNTETMGANGSLLGPTLILNKHQNVTIHVNNQIEEPTTIHWHGLHVSPENDGGPHTVIPHGNTWSPSFEVLDHASTYWYHPHLHEKTHDHVQKGIAGLIIVRDNIESALSLPRTYGIDDIPIILQTKTFDSDKQIVLSHNPYDSVFMANGTLQAQYELPAQIVRLRLLNGASERSFMIGLSENKPFYVIAGDGGLLNAPVQMTRLLLSPGERTEILIDLNGLEGNEIQLINYGSEIPNGTYGATRPGMGMQNIAGYADNILNGSQFTMLTFSVIAPTHSNRITNIPADLYVNIPWRIEDAQTTRQLTFTSMGGINGPFLINGAHFDMDVINFQIPFENIEIWELRNQTPISQPFHIHNMPFYVLDINGTPPPAHQRGRKDVILVPGGNGVVRFITRFEDFYHDSIPYMYHCHMLTHEDEGMMGQFLVNRPCEIKWKQQPQSQSASIGTTLQFVAETDAENPSYQWQSNTGFGFQNISNAGQYSGATSSTLTVHAINLTNSGQLFRCLVSQDNCQLTSQIAAIDLQLSTSLVNLNNTTLYPNPFQHTLYVYSEYPCNITAYTPEGKIIFRLNKLSKNVSINTEEWPIGMYVIKTETQHGISIQKVIKE